jgi:hypothetical protein
MPRPRSKDMYEMRNKCPLDISVLLCSNGADHLLKKIPCVPILIGSLLHWQYFSFVWAVALTVLCRFPEYPFFLKKKQKLRSIYASLANHETKFITHLAILSSVAASSITSPSSPYQSYPIPIIPCKSKCKHRTLHLNSEPLHCDTLSIPHTSSFLLSRWPECTFGRKSFFRFLKKNKIWCLFRIDTELVHAGPSEITPFSDAVRPSILVTSHVVQSQQNILRDPRAFGEIVKSYFESSTSNSSISTAGRIIFLELVSCK